jgi:hypothetical protein
MRGWDEDRRRFADQLEGARERLAAWYRRLLMAVAVLFLGVAGYVALQARPWAGSQGEWFYFAVFVVLVLSWIGSKLRFVRTSARDRWPGAGSDVGGPVIHSRTTRTGAGRVFELRIGDGPGKEDRGTDALGAGAPDAAQGDLASFTLSRSFQGRTPLPSGLAGHTPDDAGLAAAEQARAAGRDWDDICTRLTPAYQRWNGMERRLYRKYIEALLEARGRGAIRRD